MFACAARRFLCYIKEWQPNPAEIFAFRYEQNYVFDRFAIKTMKTDSRRTVNHPPVFTGSWC